MYVDEIERKDPLKFAAFLRDEKEQAPRSCWNKFANVVSFLKAQGVCHLVRKNYWPRFVEEEPEIYEKEELEALLAACDADERLWFEFFLMTGMREQEVMHTYWSDVNFRASTVRVSHKYGHIRAFSTENGHALWDFDTVRDYATVNGIPVRGGSLDGAGAVIVEGMV